MLSLNEAFYMAARAHLNDYDMGGHSYFLHPMRMAMRLRTIDEELMQIAILHDVIEDHGDMTYGQPLFGAEYKKVQDLLGLCGEEFPGHIEILETGVGYKLTYVGHLKVYGSPRVVRGVDCLTRRRGENYEDFITRCCSNYDAVKVKLEDVDDNTRVTRLKGVREKDFARMQKYHKAYLQLQEAKRKFEENLRELQRS